MASEGKGMSVFSANMRHQSYLWQISGVCFVLGMCLAAAWHTANYLSRNGAASRAGFYYGSDPQATKDAAKEAQKYEGEIKKIQNKVTELQNELAKGSDASATLNKDLQEKKFLAGLTEAIGPGIQVTLNDSRKPQPFQPADAMPPNIIHDADIQAVVNEMRAAGAEAIAINGQRVVATTSIRCVGPVVQVNGVPKAPPVLIQAIGDPDAMYGGLKTPDGVADQMSRFDPNMIKLEKKEKLTLPAFAGSTQTRFAHPPKPPVTATASKDN